MKSLRSKNKETAIHPVKACARAPSAHPLSGSGGFQGSQRQRRKIEGTLPLNAGELSLDRNGLGRRLPGEPSGSRKQVPCVSRDLR